jgi:tetratricopeptide (TPR) repeat protein
MRGARNGSGAAHQTGQQHQRSRALRTSPESSEPCVEDNDPRRCRGIRIPRRECVAALLATHTPSFPAYEALLKARQLVRAYVPEAHARALEYCQQAIALDPQFAAAYALLAFINLHSTTHTGRRMTAVAPEIRRAASRALELDPLETQPHFLLGAVAFAHDYNWSEAEREFEIALGSPSAPAEAHWSRACFLSTFARFEESTAEMRRAVELDPLTLLWRGILLAHLVCAGKYDEALDEGRKGFPTAQNEIHPLLGVAEAYLALGRLDEAVAAAERAYRNFPQHSMGAGFYAATLVRVGEKDRAAGIIREMGDTPTPIWGRAWYHLLGSEIEEAAHWYREMINTRELFAPVYGNSLYTVELRASRHWPSLAGMMNLTPI